MTDNRRTEMLAKVRALLAKADGTPYPHEADAFRSKAEALMLKYRIEVSELTPEAEDNVPVGEQMDFAWYWDSQHGGFLWSMMLDIAMHCRVRVVSWKAGSKIPVVGLPSDIEYFNMLFTSLMLEMGKGLEPKPDPNLPMIENLVKLKESGQQWSRIAEQLRAIGQLSPEQFSTREEMMEKLGAHSPYDYRIDEAIKKQVHHLNFSGRYTKYCKDNGRERLRVTPKIYQRSFAYGFTNRIGERLREMRRYVREQQTAQESSGMELVLADIYTRAQRKAVELYGEPPKVSGRGGGGRARQVQIDSGVVGKGREAANRADLGQTKVGGTKGVLKS